jgi:hypothetical protein
MQVLDGRASGVRRGEVIERVEVHPLHLAVVIDFPIVVLATEIDGAGVIDHEAIGLDADDLSFGRVEDDLPLVLFHDVCLSFWRGIRSPATTTCYHKMQRKSTFIFHDDSERFHDGMVDSDASKKKNLDFLRFENVKENLLSKGLKSDASKSLYLDSSFRPYRDT